MSTHSSEVAVLLYPGCIFFEIALAIEVLHQRFAVSFFTPDGNIHHASNGARIIASGAYGALATAPAVAVLVPGGDPASILFPNDIAAAPLRAQAARGALLAGICAGNLVLASAGLLRGRRGTHNYTPEHAPAQNVAAVAHYWNGMSFERADIVEDGQFITAQPWAYRAYAAAVGHRVGALSRAQASALETYPPRNKSAV